MRTRTAPTTRLSLLVRDLGLADACCYLLARALHAATGGRCALYKYQLMAQPIPAAAAAAAGGGRGGHGTAVRAIDPAGPLPALVRAPAVLARRFAQGAQCLAAYRGAALAGFLWYCHGPYQEDEVRARFIPPAPLAVWDFDVYVDPPYQLGPTFARLWDEANGRLRAAGVCWSMSRISAFNPASRRAHLRLGARRIGSVVFLRCGSLQLSLASLPPYLHLSAHAGSFPRFALPLPPLSREAP